MRLSKAFNGIRLCFLHVLIHLSWHNYSFVNMLFSAVKMQKVTVIFLAFNAFIMHKVTVTFGPF